MNFRLRQKSLAGNARKENVRRRSMGMLNFNNNTATTVNSASSKTTLIQQLKNSKLFSSAQSEWYNAEILYYVEVENYPKSHRTAQMVLEKRAKRQGHRYLALLRKRNDTATDVAASIYFVQLMVSDVSEDANSTDRDTNNNNHKNVECKFFFPLLSLKAIEHVEDDSNKDAVTNRDTNALLVQNEGGPALNESGIPTGISMMDTVDSEAVFIFPSVDVSFYFENDSERSRSTWIIVKIARLYAIEISIGHKIDLDAIGYAFTYDSTSLLLQFPFLKKLGLGSSTIGDTAFTEEEMEAEMLLNELNMYGNHDGKVSYLSPQELHQKLEDRKDGLQVEIINYLLQWEEEEAVPMTPSEESHGTHHRNAPTMNSLRSSTSTNNANNDNGSMLPYNDNIDVLGALMHVDEELDDVEKWLGVQIDQLTSIQSKLFLIENESGNLETSLLNLTAVQKIVQEIVSSLHLSASDEDILLNPSKVLNQALTNPLSALQVQHSLEPLLGAIRRLSKALHKRGSSANKSKSNSGMNMYQWKQIQKISAVVSQRTQLYSISETCASQMTSTYTSLFETLIKHKDLNPSVIGSNQSNKQISLTSNRKRSITMMTFPLDAFIRKNIATREDTKDYGMGTDPAANLALDSQLLYHSTLAEFMTVMRTIYHTLSSSDTSAHTSSLCNAYSNTITNFLYKPVLKVFFRDITALIGQRHASITLSNIAPHVLSATNTTINTASTSAGSFVRASVKTTQNRNNSDGVSAYYSLHRNTVNYQHPSISPWEALELSLIVLYPLLCNEEEYLMTYFSQDGSIHQDTLQPPTRLPLDYTAPTMMIYDSNTTTGVGSRPGSPTSGMHGSRWASSLGNEEHILSEKFLENVVESCARRDRSHINQSSTDKGGSANNDMKNLLSSLSASPFYDKMFQMFDDVLKGMSKWVSQPCDGMETIGMLVTLQNYMIRVGTPLYLTSLSNPLDNIKGASHSNEDSDKEEGDDEDDDEEEDAFDSEGLSIPSNAGILPPHRHSNFVNMVLYEYRDKLEHNLDLYCKEQVAYIVAQEKRADPKKAGALPATRRFATFVRQIVYITNYLLPSTTDGSDSSGSDLGSALDSVSILCYNICLTLFQSIETIAGGNAKYKDMVLLHNYGFIEDALSSLVNIHNTLSESAEEDVHGQLHCLAPFVIFASKQRCASEARYIAWMIEYEFPALYNMSLKMEGLGESIKLEELALYVRRTDITTLVSSLTVKFWENGIITLKTRLEKHMGSDSGTSGGTNISTSSKNSSKNKHDIKSRVWNTLTEEVCMIVEKLEAASLASYQISLLVQSGQVREMFNK